MADGPSIRGIEFQPPQVSFNPATAGRVEQVPSMFGSMIQAYEQGASLVDLAWKRQMDYQMAQANLEGKTTETSLRQQQIDQAKELFPLQRQVEQQKLDLGAMDLKLAKTNFAQIDDAQNDYNSIDLNNLPDYTNPNYLAIRNDFIRQHNKAMAYGPTRDRINSLLALSDQQYNESSARTEREALRTDLSGLKARAHLPGNLNVDDAVTNPDRGHAYAVQGHMNENEDTLQGLIASAADTSSIVALQPILDSIRNSRARPDNGVNDVMNGKNIWLDANGNFNQAAMARIGAARFRSQLAQQQQEALMKKELPTAEIELRWGTPDRTTGKGQESEILKGLTIPEAEAFRALREKSSGTKAQLYDKSGQPITPTTGAAAAATTGAPNILQQAGSDERVRQIIRDFQDRKIDADEAKKRIMGTALPAPTPGTTSAASYGPTYASYGGAARGPLPIGEWITGIGTEFGEVDNPRYGGYTEANWDRGAWGDTLSGWDTKGVALPGVPRGTLVEIVDPTSGRSTYATVKDKGPGRGTGAAIDLLAGTRADLGLPRNFKGRLQFRIVSGPSGREA